MERIQVAKDFHSGELECPCCKGLVYDQRMIDLLQIMRDIMGIPFVIRSYYRCRIHNDKLLNSSNNSQHLMGKAVDISTAGWSGNQKWELVSCAVRYRLSIGLYKNHIHLDNRVGSPNIWYGSY